ncbi:hypothetical protein FNH22_11450 [Fulvivirga sp. M361]|uniref:hypothetical protein n=1 Tax=Fulvivirga sp. M361 TaxID=2594266 RepID=UPI001179D450|nr:hypothetical protein [Fulvivirga sp. M361]TRX59131.1 hypothetical protein FNH22_11450 [Fulvivirga sp. M361]
MDTPDPFHQLSQTFDTDTSEKILNSLCQVKNEEMKENIRMLLISDRCMNSLIQRVLHVHGLVHALQRFCDLLNTELKETFISFSSKGFSPGGAFGKAPDEKIISLLYQAFTYLCRYAREKHTSFILVGLSSVDSRYSLIIDTDIPFFINANTSPDISICMALNYIDQINGRLKEDCIGLEQQMFRLTLAVDVAASL